MKLVRLSKKEARAGNMLELLP